MSTSLRRWAAAPVLLATLATAGASVQAAVVFDSFTGGQSLYNTCFTCEPSNPNRAELGDIITLAGTERTVTAASARLAQTRLISGGVYDASVTMSLYSVDLGTLATSLLGSATTVVTIGSTGLVDVNFTFANIAVPTTLYYGLSISSPSPDIAGLHFGLWDYWSPANNGDGSLTIGSDPGTVVIGPTNVSTVVYGRLVPGGALIASTNNDFGVTDLSLGFTPNVQITAVPEPETYGLMALGLIAVGAYVRRRKQA